MKVIIDCNIFVSAVSSRSEYHLIVQSLIKGIFQLAVSTDVYCEYEEKITEKYNQEIAEDFLEAMDCSPFVKPVEIFYKWNLIYSDPDDNKYVDLHIAAGADYIVTNDRHFDILKTIEFPRIQVINIDEFMTLLKQPANESR